ncbi:MAG: glycoside hydrolase family 3 C-terminal domain-containing protein [Bryobacteraceae bacterium]
MHVDQCLRSSARFSILLIAGLAIAQRNSPNPKYKDPSATPEQRAADLVSRMTLDEKVSQMQNVAVAIPRLGIPAYDWWNEALHGVARAGLATVFPQAIGLAATFDTKLEQTIADAISTEARAKYNDAIAHDNHARYYGLTFWSPNINIFRDPRWGRGQETFGEDPYLTSQIAIAFIKGMQGDDPHYFKTIATSKHFAVHSGPETTRHQFDARVSQADLLDTYLPAFRATVENGPVDSIMCAYNSVDGAPACASRLLLQTHLRHDWKFNGYVVSDCGAIGDVYEGHKYRPSMPAAAAAAVKAGTDLSCGTEYGTLVDAVHKKLISEKEIDRSVERLFAARFKLGMFDPADRVPFSKIGMDEVESPAHQQLALEAAEESMVLLKNDGQALPVNGKARLAVVGPAADDPDALLANYNGIPSHIITPLAGIRSRFTADRVEFALGSLYTDQSAALIPTSVLTPQGGNGSLRGLSAEYFDSDDFSGKPKLSRIEPVGYSRWDMHDPEVLAAVSREKFSLRWAATLRVGATGDYALGVKRLNPEGTRGTDSAKLYVDDRLLVDASGRKHDFVGGTTTVMRLEAGKAYRLRAEYRQNGGPAGLELVWKPPADVSLAEAVRVARSSDVTLVFAGLNSNLEGEESRLEIPGFAGGDRTDLDLPDPQERLINALCETGKPTIVVLVNGSALGIETEKRRAAAILEAWYPGQEGGTAIANILAGDYNPGGRLPVTFYQSVDQLPPFDDYWMRNRTYRYFMGTPTYPFGYGLSYSDFHYSNLTVAGGNISVRVTNTSSRDGDEVVQLFQTDAAAPHPELRGFQRIHLKAGEAQTVTFRCPTLKDTKPAKGKFLVSIGGGQPGPWAEGHYVQTVLTLKRQ